MPDVAKKNPGQVSAYLDSNLIEKLRLLAKAEDRSISYLVERAVREMIGRPEAVSKWGRQVDIEEAISSTKAKRPAKPK